jgi:hypothetical protein
MNMTFNKTKPLAKEKGKRKSLRLDYEEVSKTTDDLMKSSKLLSLPEENDE